MNDNMKNSSDKKHNVNKQALETPNPQSSHNLQHFIPSGINPDNGQFFEGNHNSLSSKGE